MKALVERFRARTDLLPLKARGLKRLTAELKATSERPALERGLADITRCWIPGDIQAVRSNGDPAYRWASPDQDEDPEPRCTKRRKTITAHRHTYRESSRRPEYKARMADTKRRVHGEIGSRGGREPGKGGAAQSTKIFNPAPFKGRGEE